MGQSTRQGEKCLQLAPHPDAHAPVAGLSDVILRMPLGHSSSPDHLIWQQRVTVEICWLAAACRNAGGTALLTAASGNDSGSSLRQRSWWTSSRRAQYR